jgi:hypothetical protein
MAEASHLPYTSLLGVCQYPSAYTRLKMRYAMSILSRFRTKWGKKHFEVLVKTLEYGYATGKMGLKYDGNQTEDKSNVLEGYADSSLSPPPVSRLSLCYLKQCSNLFYLEKTHHH